MITEQAHVADARFLRRILLALVAATMLTLATGLATGLNAVNAKDVHSGYQVRPAA